MRGTGHARPPREARALDRHARGTAEAPGSRGGRLLLPAALRPKARAAVGLGGLGRRTGLGMALGRRRLPRAAHATLAGGGGPLARIGGGGSGRRRTG